MSMSSCLKSKTIPALANDIDRLALLDFKNGKTQDPLFFFFFGLKKNEYPLQIMSSWNDSVHFCNWIGVTCSHSN